MSQVIDLASFRKRAPAPSWDEIIAKSTDDVTADWQAMARNNRLNEYFKSCAPSFMNHEVNYMNDLNGLSRIEQILECWLVIHAPSTSSKKQMGWIASFNLNDRSISTPELASETYARAFAVILFLKLKRALLQAQTA